MSKETGLVLEERPVDAAIMAQGEFEYWTTTEKGITFNADIPEEEWLNATHRIVQMYVGASKLHCRAMFMLGDALRFGEDKFGERYAQAIDTTRGVMKISHKTVENAGWIAGSVPEHLRHIDTLTFTHHEIVAKLKPEEQAALLDQAEEEGISTPEFKKVVKEKHPKKNGTKAPAHAPQPGDEELEKYESMNDEQAVDAMESLITFFDKEFEEAPFKNWPKGRQASFKPGMEELLRIMRRAVANGKKKA